MTQHDPYDAWRQTRRSELPSDGFTERVMATIVDRRSALPAPPTDRVVMANWPSRRGKAVLFVAAGAAFAFRLAAAIAVFFAAP